MIKIENERKKIKKARYKWNRKERIEEEKQNEMKWTGNKIGATGAMKIAEALMTNTTLTELDLSGDDKDIKWKKKRIEEAR